jgi:hypothetical protein
MHAMDHPNLGFAGGAARVVHASCVMEVLRVAITAAIAGALSISTGCKKNREAEVRPRSEEPALASAETERPDLLHLRERGELPAQASRSDGGGAGLNARPASPPIAGATLEHASTPGAAERNEKASAVAGGGGPASAVAGGGGPASEVAGGGGPASAVADGGSPATPSDGGVAMGGPSLAVAPSGTNGALSRGARAAVDGGNAGAAPAATKAIGGTNIAAAESGTNAADNAPAATPGAAANDIGAGAANASAAAASGGTAAGLGNADMTTGLGPGSAGAGAEDPNATYSPWVSPSFFTPYGLLGAGMSSADNPAPPSAVTGVGGTRDTNTTVSARLLPRGASTMQGVATVTYDGSGNAALAVDVNGGMNGSYEVRIADGLNCANPESAAPEVSSGQVTGAGLLDAGAYAAGGLGGALEDATAATIGQMQVDQDGHGHFETAISSLTWPNGPSIVTRKLLIQEIGGASNPQLGDMRGYVSCGVISLLNRQSASG